MSNPFQKNEPTVAHNMRQILGCAPILGSLVVGILGIVAFVVGLNKSDHMSQGPVWLIGGSIGLVASAIGFGVLAWLVWANRQDEPGEGRRRTDRPSN